VPLTYGSELDQAPDPAIFVLDFQDTNKNNFFPCFFAYYFLKAHLHHFSKIKRHKKVTKQYLGIKVFLTILLDDSQNPDPYLWLMDLDP
jgi:hypothetical protein